MRGHLCSNGCKPINKEPLKIVGLFLLKALYLDEKKIPV
jgi:hypothetical protein